MDREIGVRTKAIIVALLVCLSAPQLGCASVAKQGSGSTERAATAVKNKDKKKPSEEKAAQTSGTKTEEKKESDDKDQKSDDSKKEDNKSSDSSKSDSKGNSSDSKQNSGNSQGSGSNNSSSNSGSQKKWVAEQGHWETDYSQVWVPNVVYTRHNIPLKDPTYKRLTFKNSYSRIYPDTCRTSFIYTCPTCKADGVMKVFQCNYQTR